MKVEVARDKLLTNYEVMDHITQVRQRHRANRSQYMQSQNLETILLEVQSYLLDRPTANPGKEQTKEHIERVVRELVPMQLEKAEILQIINSAPGSAPVLYSLVEECDERLSESQIEHILNLCSQYLGEEPTPDQDEQK